MLPALIDGKDQEEIVRDKRLLARDETITTSFKVNRFAKQYNERFESVPIDVPRVCID